MTRLSFTAAAASDVVLAGIALAGCGGSSPQELPTVPNDPIAVACAFTEGLVVCEAPYARRAFRLVSPPPRIDESQWLDLQIKGCRSDQPPGPVHVSVRLLSKDAHRATVLTRVRWDRGGGEGGKLELVLDPAGWRVKGGI
jgi:hypothetical protein